MLISYYNVSNTQLIGSAMQCVPAPLGTSLQQNAHVLPTVVARQKKSVNTHEPCSDLTAFTKRKQTQTACPLKQQSNCDYFRVFEQQADLAAKGCLCKATSKNPRILSSLAKQKWGSEHKIKCINAFKNTNIKSYLKLTLQCVSKKDFIKSIYILEMLFNNMADFFMNTSHQHLPRININKVLNTQQEAQQAVEEQAEHTHRMYNYTNLQTYVAMNIANCSVMTNYQKCPSKTSLYTLIRSPFVFKKTREQFGVSKTTYYTSIFITGNTHAKILLTFIKLLKLPVELKIQSSI